MFPEVLGAGRAGFRALRSGAPAGLGRAAGMEIIRSSECRRGARRVGAGFPGPGLTSLLLGRCPRASSVS